MTVGPQDVCFVALYGDRKVPRKYVDGSIIYDLAWAEVEEQPGQHSLQVREDPVESAVHSTMYFRQPYDLEATWDASESVVGAISAILYPSMKSPLLEVLDVGFRGMSGALAIDANQPQPLVLGMMSRRAKPIELNIVRTHHSTGDILVQRVFLNTLTLITYLDYFRELRLA